MARFCLGCLSHHYGFIAGAMDLYLSDIERPSRTWLLRGPAVENRPHHMILMQGRVFNALQAPQQRNLHFVEEFQRGGGYQKEEGCHHAPWIP